MQFAADRRREINAGLRMMADGGGFGFVDPTEAFVCGGANSCGYYQDDLLHLLPAGYERLWTVLLPALDTKR